MQHAKRCLQQEKRPIKYKKETTNTKEVLPLLKWETEVVRSHTHTHTHTHTSHHLVASLWRAQGCSVYAHCYGLWQPSREETTVLPKSSLLLKQDQHHMIMDYGLWIWMCVKAESAHRSPCELRNPFGHPPIALWRHMRGHLDPKWAQRRLNEFSPLTLTAEEVIRPVRSLSEEDGLWNGIWARADAYWVSETHGHTNCKASGSTCLHKYATVDCTWAIKHKENYSLHHQIYIITIPCYNMHPLWDFFST